MFSSFNSCWVRYIKCTRELRRSRMKCRLTFLNLLHLLIFVQCELFWNFPRNSREVFHAYVNEKAHTIQVFPSIQVKLTNDSKLCSISLLSSGRNSVPNFIHGNVLNQEKGYGYLTFNETSYRHAKSLGSLEARTGFYHLKIIAEDCSHPTKSTKSWPITFEHIQSDLPIWSKTKYAFEIDSLHRPGHEVGKVTAYTSAINMTENDNFLYGDDTGMCAYTIQDPSYSFAIDGHGVIRSLIRFNNHTDMLYEFNVTGFDCHLPIPYSSTVPVTVYVKAVCVSQWNVTVISCLTDSGIKVYNPVQMGKSIKMKGILDEKRSQYTECVCGGHSLYIDFVISVLCTIFFPNM